MTSKELQLINNAQQFKRALTDQFERDFSGIMPDEYIKGHESAIEMAIKLFDIWFMEFPELPTLTTQGESLEGGGE